MNISGQGCIRSNENYLRKEEIGLQSNNVNGIIRILQNKKGMDCCNVLYDINKVNVLYTNIRSLTSGTKREELKNLNI